MCEEVPTRPGVLYLDVSGTQLSDTDLGIVLDCLADRKYVLQELDIDGTVCLSSLLLTHTHTNTDNMLTDAAAMRVLRALTHGLTVECLDMSSLPSSSTRTHTLSLSLMHTHTHIHTCMHR